MNESNTYTLKKYDTYKKYVEFVNEELILKDIRKGIFSLILFKKEIDFQFNSIRLPQSIYNRLLELLSLFELSNFIEDFLFLMAQLQYKYILHTDLGNSSMESDFINEKKDLEKLLNTLEKYLHGDKKELHSILFKFNTEKTISISNFFTVDDIFQALVCHFSLTKDNICHRKKEILSDCNDFNFNKADRYIIREAVISLIQFFSDKKNETFSDNKILKFCGVFLHLSQIPINKEDDISVGEIKDALDLIPYENLRNISKREIKSL